MTHIKSLVPSSNAQSPELIYHQWYANKYFFRTFETTLSGRCGKRHRCPAIRACLDACGGGRP
jgi:hypothetical protein